MNASFSVSLTFVIYTRNLKFLYLILLFITFDFKLTKVCVVNPWALCIYIDMCFSTIIRRKWIHLPVKVWITLHCMFFICIVYNSMKLWESWFYQPRTCKKLFSVKIFIYIKASKFIFLPFLIMDKNKNKNKI
jgi:hypothetical protein